MRFRTFARWLVLSVWLAIIAAWLLGQRPAMASQQERELAERARRLLNQRCFQCHGLNGVANKDVFVLDRARLVAAKVVIPGDADSPLLKAVESSAMPLGGPKLSAAEQATLRDWILSGAPDWDNTATQPRAFLSEPALLALIQTDLEKSPPRTRPYLRYFSLAHLANAQVPEDELERDRTALAKLINSLSWHREITRPTPIDPARTLFRIDLRDYQWTAATWQTILNAYPYGVLTPRAEPIARLSGEVVPYVRADWFVFTASVPPLYHEVLGLPLTVRELERLLGVDTTRDLAEEKNVVRAGVRNSGVSQNNRVLERHVSPYGAYWQSYDFRGNLGDQNIFQDPLRLHPAGGEIIFNLPNGLQAYFLMNARGQRLNTAPIEIVSDRHQPDDPVIRNGRSCMSCHYAGMQSFKDDVRPAWRGLAIVAFDRDKVLALYPAQETLDRVLAEDQARFNRAVAQAGEALSRSAEAEPINALSRRFKADLDLRQASAEAGLEMEEFQQRVRWNTRLGAFGLRSLLAPGGGLKRETWEREFRVLARELQIGEPVTGAEIAARSALAGSVAQVVELNLTDSQLRGASPVIPRAVNSGPSDVTALLRSARTIFVFSRTLYLKPEVMEQALRQQPEFQAFGWVIVKDAKAADLRIELDRPSLTFDFTFSVTHQPSSIAVTSGKVVAWDGNVAAGKITKELVKQIQAARSPATAAPQK